MDTLCPQGTHLPLLFQTPSECICDRVYTEDAHGTAASVEDTDCGDDPDSEQTDETSDHIIVRSYRQLVNLVQTQQAPTSMESSNLVLSERCPYRSQGPISSPVHSVNKQYKHVQFNRREKKPSQTVYVTVEVFQQSQEGSK